MTPMLPTQPTLPGIPQHTSNSGEWFTDTETVASARRALGGRIGLDPASCVEANLIVQAGHIYTAADSGLEHQWVADTVFCNPPYGRLGPKFVAKLLTHFDAGHIGAAVLVVKAAVETKWFAPLWRFPMCFPSRRLQFSRPGGADVTSAPHASVIVCLTDDPLTAARFAREFSAVGPIAIIPRADVWNVWLATVARATRRGR